MKPRWTRATGAFYIPSQAKTDMDWFDSVRLDEVLRMFDSVKSGMIPADLLLNPKKAPEDWRKAIDFLTEEGYLKQFDDYYEITYRGKAMLHDGGFVRKDRRERALFYCAVIAAVCSLLGLIVALVALVCQINR